MTTRDVTIYNLDEYLHYEVVPESQQIVITWDTDITELNYLMRYEYIKLNSTEYLTSSMWVNELKKIWNWEQGKTFTLVLYSYLTRERIVIQLCERNLPAFSLRINEDGYLTICNDSHESKEYIRCHCLYNDLLDEELDPYVMK
jgi:hypothetical protein